MAKYNPEQMSEAEVALGDDQMVEGWLKEEVAKEHGRHFAQRPAEEQIPMLLIYAQELRDQLASVDEVRSDGTPLSEAEFEDLREIEEDTRSSLLGVEGRLRSLGYTRAHHER